MSPEERGAAYEATLSPAYRAEVAKHLAELERKEQEYATRPWRVYPSPPPTMRTIRGEVVPEPLDDDAIMDKLRRAKAKAEPDDDARRTREINRQLEKERLLRRRLQGKPKAFFR